MNTNQSHQIRTATFATFIAIVACVSTAASTFAVETHGDGEGVSGSNGVSPYAVPITALDGLTLAQYIQKHQDAGPRTATGV
jgi:hypothetical protein